MAAGAAGDSSAGNSADESPIDSETASQESELRLRRSLEMLSSGARRDGGEQGFKPNSHNPGGHNSGGHNSGGHNSGGQNPGGHASNSYSPSSHTASNHTANTHGGANPRRHRFKDDGEVPVVHVANHRDRSLPPGVATAPHRPSHHVDPHAAEDRAARERAERALEAAKETIRQLQTRAGHAELALREALSDVESHQQAMAALRQELGACQADLAQARTAVDRAEEARIAAEADAAEEFDRQRAEYAALQEELRQLRLENRKAEKAAAPRVAAAAAPRKPATIRRKTAAPAVPEVEEEPVKWWLPAPKKTAATGRGRR